MADLLKEAGLPDGVFNVVQGDKVAVDAILEHPTIAAVSFVGSTPIARYIYETGTRNGKRVQALGGAKNHMIVLPDADIDMAADAAVSAGYGSAGERCMAISVIVAVGDVADPLVAAIQRAPAQGEGRPGQRPGVRDGPARDARASRQGGGLSGRRSRAGGDRRARTAVRTPAFGGDGFFLGVSLIDDVRPGHDAATRTRSSGRCSRSSARPPTTRRSALVNDNPYGNGVAIFTRDGGAARQFQFDVNVGMVGVNVPIPVPVSYYSFGGWKASLFGDQHMYGPDGINFYTRQKVVTSRWPDPGTSSVDLGFPRTR